MISGGGGAGSVLVSVVSVICPPSEKKLAAARLKFTPGNCSCGRKLVSIAVLSPFSNSPPGT